MITLINQLATEIQELFNNRDDEFKDVLVKPKYKKMPKGKYPKVIIEEIQNSEIESRSTTEGERSTALGYQITVYSRDMQEYDAIDSVREILNIIDEFLQPPNYNLQRIGSPAIVPYISDSTIMTGAIRYTCVYDKDTNLIYRN